MAKVFASSYSSLREDSVLEPPGGVHLLHARAVAGRPPGADFGGPAPGDAEATVAAADPRLWADARPPSVYECSRCGWYPARRIQVAHFASLLLSAAVRREVQALCRPCAVRRHLGAQTRTYLFGFLGVGIVIAPFFLARNAINRLFLWRLPRPYFRAPEVVTKRTEPASFAGTLPIRLLCWLAPLVAIAAVGISLTALSS